MTTGSIRKPGASRKVRISSPTLRAGAGTTRRAARQRLLGIGLEPVPELGPAQRPGRQQQRHDPKARTESFTGRGVTQARGVRRIGQGRLGKIGSMDCMRPQLLA